MVSEDDAVSDEEEPVSDGADEEPVSDADDTTSDEEVPVSNGVDAAS